MSQETVRVPAENGTLRAEVNHTGRAMYIELDGRFAYANASAVRLFRASSSAALIGRPVLECVPTAWQAVVTERMRLVRERSEGALPSEKQYARLDGSIFDVDVWASPIQHAGLSGSVVLFRDASVRQEECDPDERDRALLRAVIEGTTDAIYVKDREGRFLLVNSAACRFAGRSAEEMVGRDDTSVFTPEGARAGMERDRALMARRTTETHEEELTWANGERITVLATEGPVLDDSGEVIGLFGIARDITERKQAEVEKNRLRDQLQHAQKMEIVGRLAGGVAHDFNNLLTVINGYSQLLLGELGAGDPMFDSLDEIRKAGERAAALTRQLLILSRKQIVRSKVLDVNALIVDTARMLARVIGEDVRLEIDLSPSLGRVRADSGQIQQVLLNLAVNARDAMPAGGTLLIRTEDVQLGEDYAQQHSEVKPGAYVLMEVSDTGIGMEENVKAHLFEPFFTTKKPGEGTGLGLTMVYGIVMQSGGSIWTYSEPGEGTTFKIYLPRMEEGTTPNARAPLPVPLSLEGTETVLVVEDDENLRKVVRAGLMKYGYDVLEAANPGEALLLAERHPGPIHLALTDMVMEGMQGTELALRLKDLKPQMRVIFMSGYSEPFLMQRGILDRDVSYLSKPFSPEALATRVREVLGPPRRATILVVEDEPEIRVLLRRVLSGAGYNVVDAKDGSAGMVEARKGEVDLVITDLVMPEMEGLQMIQILHKERPDLKIIAISGMFDGQFLKVAGLLGAQATLAKPLRPDDLLATVKQVLLGGGR
jgi:PAS domain S-box-containing protein